MAPIPNRHDVSATLMTLDLSSHSISKLLPPPPAPEYESLTTNTPALKSQNAFNAQAAAMAVSCDTLVTNLISESTSNTVETSACPCQSQEKEVVSESYWDMPSTTDCGDIENATTNDDEEEVPEEDVLSASDIQRLLVTDAFKRSRSEARGDTTISAPAHSRNSYWEWTSEEPITTKEQQRAKVIQEILQDEKIRLILSSENIIRNETQVDITAIGPQKTHMHFTPEHSDNYWAWEQDEETKEEEVAPHVNDPTHPMHSYWDFPSEPITFDEKKREICARILEQEKIRQVLSCANNSRFQPQKIDCETTTTATYVHGSHVEDQSDEVHQYWDFPSTVDDKYLEEAKCEDVLSANHIIQHLLVNCNANTTQSANTESNSSNNQTQSYWDW